MKFFLDKEVFSSYNHVQKGGNSLKDRLKKLRKELDLKQREFAEKIGTSPNILTNYETGRRNPSNSVINNICKTFNVNEEWLRNGIGDMFQPISRETEIENAVRNLLSGESDSFKSRLISLLAGLSLSDWERLETEAKKLFTDKNSNTSTKTISDNKEELSVTVEEAEAEYIKSISNFAKNRASTASNTTADIEKKNSGENKAASQ